ncbi:NAD(P)/FAD-dependent oxidoreductase [Gordonia sp. (in: high G+C Gram-positive bacteria)]|jgi:tryptophan 2-monooxygenase|uniref:flavin monoamine oxidase family protein n=1 Tax=Gordonia sp. (in: high G+C Gram-positive bacteria) TaxID=84139 RepID=UPI002618EB11|nr:NAD(P)/FAD-dependent oxidoreductase [Gordonia sp. (in: high G+C Gram-positive bacteria)]HMS77176.1 NAD(P)/FAD-dependent oxidoreductase [Gordonia sp. (in: high G+C Gram-positive bacteria)]
MAADAPITIFGPDFPFAYDDWLRHPAGLGTVPGEALGAEVAVIGAGMAGMVAAYELMKLGLKPVVYEAERIGGRLRSEPFVPGEPEIAELGGMRFPISSRAFFHYVDMFGLTARPFPNPLTPASGSTVIDIGGQTLYARTLNDLPEIYREIANAWDAALERIAGFGDLQDAIRRRDTDALKERWNTLVREWDDRSFYDFLATSDEFGSLSYRHRELFGQVGFGTGGWDSDFANSMLEILRVVVTACDSDQFLIEGGSEQVPRRLWSHAPGNIAHWPAGTSLSSLHRGAPKAGVARIRRLGADRIEVTDRWGDANVYPAVVATCQAWLLSTEIDCDETLFSQDMWMALDRTRYMQSSKTFVMVDRPFWKDIDPATGRDVMSMTLTDRLTRGTYFFDNGPDRPAVICLTYTWMSDALKVLPHPVERRVELALSALRKIYPDVDIEKHIVGRPLTVSWEDEPHFLGAFKGALPGHYRYNTRMYGHFHNQAALPDAERGIFIAGDDVSFMPAWVEGAVQTGLNAVWGVLSHFGGHTSAENPGPGDLYARLGPIDIGD